MSSLGSRLESLRCNAKLSKEAVARVVDVKGATIGKWERDEVIPRDHNLRKLAAYFGVSFEWLRVGIDGSTVFNHDDNDVVVIQSFFPDERALVFDSKELVEPNSSNLVYLKMNDDSGGDIFPYRSILIIDVKDKHIKDEKIYVLRRFQYLLIRKLSFTTGGVRLQSLSDAGPSEVISFQALSDVELIGRVVSSISPR
ncbi:MULTISPECIES: LexA family transcriptional regulator [Vibrio harveyi group]|uniref:Helix-turn-helix domain-containing protein n=1 Tax=Vibrio owensii TaxID=696485 RepID=A0AAP9KE75_9VIBR|nr:MULTISPECIES: helix-turn-helix domain-containing protein [Vibrio harveyi group]EGQ7678712.1 helix-turn-helix domain-containing protein [Vibrio parahaemolyticus]EHR5321679.1 helix-turn-helix domain-containing protein [Vibrio parahaemolyticus]EKQ5902017.1 helix-turn-helix domain-containing protein [Vibrio parahaemolyticus]ELA9713777.1 helix-turn-helix domain-containing protein [Vibrio parahaemolyticus]ELA9727393.1 helix-turn-helix domain-containing protein [Vibrio parahaemolyticus]